MGKSKLPTIITVVLLISSLVALDIIRQAQFRGDKDEIVLKVLYTSEKKGWINSVAPDFPEWFAERNPGRSVRLQFEVQGFTKVFDSMFSIEHEELLEEIEKVSQIETDIDENYKQLKYEIAFSTGDVPAGALIILDHAIRDIELSSDLIEDCAEMVRSLVLLK